MRLAECVQGDGFYVGVAFWPGGSINDWGPVHNATLNYTGLTPCESAAEYNATGLTHQQYLVRTLSCSDFRRWQPLGAATMLTRL
jgi:hypothetical protein